VTEIVAEAWFRDRGDETHRLEYDLDCSSVVIDVGGYKGQWASDIYAKYRPQKIIVYEPHPAFYASIKQRFASNTDINMKCCGLGASDREVELVNSSDGSTEYARSENQECVKVRFVNADQEFQRSKLDIISLIKINIEGSEYELLEHLIETNWHLKIQNIQVQFHDNVPDYRSKLAKLTDQLIFTHKRSYCYPMVWENWSLR
jgi:FkbM family methyltransferase